MKRQFSFLLTEKKKPENFIFFTFGFKEMLFHVFLPFLQKNEKMQIILIYSDERRDEMAQISHSRFHWFSQVKLRVTQCS